MKNKLMTHVVAGYPTQEDCLNLLLGMQKAGVYAVEIQIPFTDPSADGPTIMHANDVALANSMSIDACFNLIRKARSQGLTTPLYLMSYANKLFRFGFKEFCEEANRCQIQGLIIPDLPFDTSEYKELLACCGKTGIELVPVLSPGVSLHRLKGYGLEKQRLIYVTSTKGITGKQLTVHHELERLIKHLRSITKAELALGFGIVSLDDINQTLAIADVAVIGSQVIRTIDQQGVSGAQTFIKELVNPKGEVK